MTERTLTDGVNVWPWLSPGTAVTVSADHRGCTPVGEGWRVHSDTRHERYVRLVERRGCTLEVHRDQVTVSP